MKIIKEITLIFIGFSVGLTFFAWLFGGIKTENVLKFGIVNGTAGVLLWWGNGYLADWLSIHYPWEKNTRKRLFLSLITTVVYTFLAWLVIIYMWQILFLGQLDVQNLAKHLSFESFLGTLMLTIVVSTFVHGSGFLMAWKETLIEAERLKKEQIAAKYEVLRNQVNPHFLFNSLNVLTTLVHKDADLAEQFIKQLSNNYRYVLDTREREVVSLDEEVKNLASYIFLMKIRFGDNLKTDISAEIDGQIAPLTLQMLVENALKHNEISKAYPLSISVFLEADYIVIKNNIQLKKSTSDSTGIGLENIKARYKFLTDKPIIVTHENGYFIVKIPVVL